ncbi:hypothetical protein TRFO_38919 [Tritrichomonas foetus]|uniref:Uncharacterized protein n=1 Tax=Tritrichomonas foetus TaxID=1144522 RepID=A0A1J4J8A6_9EUKA|nr:hypothetical protein TRFO_38919 [Tritrichomonas foetus]|eukprot:OHS94921.1 hypothetical protein TRFO_38919 [Tritrichomonas foetus]
MFNEYFILDKIKKETDIEALKNLFIKTVNEYETQLTDNHEANSIQTDLLNQRLSESNACIDSLKEKIKKMKELHDADIDLLRENEKQLQSLLKSTQRENSELRLLVENKEEVNENPTNKNEFISIQEKNAKLVEQLARCKEDYADLYDSFQFVRESLAKMSKSNRKLRAIVVSFIESTNKSLGLAHHASSRACQYAADSELKVKSMISGLASIKAQLQDLKVMAPEFPKLNMKALKIRLNRKFNQVLSTEILRQKADYSVKERKMTTETLLSAEHALKIVMAMKFLSVGTSSSFSMFHKYFVKNLQELKRVCAHFVSTFQIYLDTQQLKFQKKIKEKEQEIRTLKTENELLKKTNENTKLKLKLFKDSMSEAQTIKRRATARASRKLTSSSLATKSTTKTTESNTLESISEINPTKNIELVNVETQSGLINMALIRDRTIRHSKEAELSVVQAELGRTKEQNQKLIEQIAGLRKMLKRAGESASEETGKTRQTIGDLETQLREEKRIVQRKTAQYLKLQKDNEDLALVASKVEPLKRVIAMLFKNFSDRLTPLLAEQSISNELIELDELAQEIFNVPIHKICGPTYSRGFLKKQERKLNGAIANSIEVEEITKVFDSMINELQKLSQETKCAK